MHVAPQGDGSWRQQPAGDVASVPVHANSRPRQSGSKVSLQPHWHITQMRELYLSDPRDRPVRPNSAGASPVSSRFRQHPPIPGPQAKVLAGGLRGPNPPSIPRFIALIFPPHAVARKNSSAAEFHPRLLRVGREAALVPFPPSRRARPPCLPLLPNGTLAARRSPSPAGTP